MTVRKSMPLRALVLATTRTAEELAAAKAALAPLDVTVVRSVDAACRTLAGRCPEVVVVDDADDEASIELEARMQVALPDADRAPRILGASLDDASLSATALGVARRERAERVATSHAAQLRAAQSLGDTAQWLFDAEARVFAWLPSGSTRFASLQGEGSVEECLLRFVNREDRARVEQTLGGRSSGNTEYRLVLPDGTEREIVQKTLERRDPVTGRRTLLGTIRDVTEKRRRERTLERLAHYDAATGLPNREHVCLYLQTALDTARRNAESVAVLSFGIDAFRTIEDTFGRAASETVLLEVASRLQLSLVETDADGVRVADGMTARHGPHELLVVLRATSADDAAAFFTRASVRLGAPITVTGTPLVATCSAGVAIGTPSASSMRAESFLVHADAALHIAMREGRGRLVVYNQKMRDTLERKRVVEQRLRESLERGVGLELHYQPKVVAHSGRVRAVEALLRSSADPRGPVSPLELVAAAEESGLVHVLGDFVLRTACMQACQWARERMQPLRVAVNVSAQQLARAGFAERVAAVLAETKLAPELLELEITEGVLMADVEGARRLLADLRDLGVRIALDDFGTGYSSLAYLTRLPIDTLKIDRSFVTEIGVSRKGEAILTAILALADSLGLDIVAEGVETAEQQSFFAQHGELEIQGWLHSKALPATELVVWLERRCASLGPRPAIDCRISSNAPGS